MDVLAHALWAGVLPVHRLGLRRRGVEHAVVPRGELHGDRHVGVVAAAVAPCGLTALQADRLASRSSARAWRTTVRAPVSASSAIAVATIRSGHAVPVPNTPSAASITARLPSTSLRVQIHTERMLASPLRNRYNSAATAAFTASAAKPTAPIVVASGGTPACAFHSAWPSTNTPKAPMQPALNSAALERAAAVMPSTARLIA